MTKPDSVVASLGVLVFSTALLAQSAISISPRSRPEPVLLRPAANLRLDVKLVQIPVTVTDLRGQPLVELPQSAFRLFEDEVEQPISTFSMTDAPISATLVFDSSRSMKGRIDDARAAVDQFLNARLMGDEFSLVRFSDKAELLSAFTDDWADISRRLSFVEPRGWTALYDAICLGTHQGRKAHNQRKVVVVFSDGGDNNSRYSENELIRLLREADVQVYALSMFERPRVLERITEETGGRALWVKRLDDLPPAIETLNRQIRSEYVIGYSPGAVPNDGKYHRIRIEVRPPAGVERVRASWRRGYTAPGE
jgi:Ca-activated chloride channel homolog